MIVLSTKCLIFLMVIVTFQEVTSYQLCQNNPHYPCQNCISSNSWVTDQQNCIHLQCHRNNWPSLYSCKAVCKYINCSCNSIGSHNDKCDDNGQCSCKTGYQGLRCDSCAQDYFGFPNCQGM